MTDPCGLVPAAALNLGPVGISQPTVSTDLAVRVFLHSIFYSSWQFLGAHIGLVLPGQCFLQEYLRFELCIAIRLLIY